MTPRAACVRKALAFVTALLVSLFVARVRAAPLSEATIVHVGIDRDVLVLATPEGIWLAPRSGPTQRVVTFDGNEERSPGRVACVTRARGGRVLAYLTPNEGALRVRFDDEERAPSLRPGQVNAVAVASDGVVAAARRRFVERYDPSTERVDVVQLPSPFLADRIAYAPDDTLYLAGSDLEKSALVAVRDGVASKIATFETRVTHLWPSKTAIWVVDGEGALLRVDAVSHAITRYAPRVGKIVDVAGATTASGDVIAVVGEVAAIFDGAAFVYPKGAIHEAHGVVLDPVDASLYVIARDRKLVRVPVEHPRLAVRRGEPKPRAVPQAATDKHGPIDDKAGADGHRATVPTVRLGYGVGFTPAEKEATTEFDAMAGLRIGVRFEDEPALHLWPEIGYSASAGGNYVAAGAALQYGNYAVTAGPSLRALYGADQGGEGSGGVRTSLHVAFVSGLLQLEAGHQAMFQRGAVRHDTRALASIDLFTAGGVLFYLGVPVACVAGVVLTRL